MTQIWFDGQIVDQASPVISADNSALQFGESVFTTIRCYDSKPFQLDQHCRRLLVTLESGMLPFQFEVRKTEIKNAISQLLQANKKTNAIVRLTIFSEKGRAVMMISCRPVTVTEAQQCEGVSIFVSSLKRDGEGQTARYKTGSYLENHFVRREAENAGAYEGLILSTEDDVLEGAYTNLFMIKDGAVVTPPLTKNLLPGIARDLVLECCNEKHFPVEQRPVKNDELKNADELFLTNCHIEILPVCKLITKGSTVYKTTGVLTQKLIGAYRDRVREFLKR